MVEVFLCDDCKERLDEERSREQELASAAEFFCNDVSYKAPEQIPGLIPFYVRKFREALATTKKGNGT